MRGDRGRFTSWRKLKLQKPAEAKEPTVEDILKSVAVAPSKKRNRRTRHRRHEATTLAGSVRDALVQAEISDQPALFAAAWRQYRDGEITHEQYRDIVEKLRARVIALLKKPPHHK